jgi:hypothetical protein
MQCARTTCTLPLPPLPPSQSHQSHLAGRRNDPDPRRFYFNYSTVGSPSSASYNKRNITDLGTTVRFMPVVGEPLLPLVVRALTTNMDVNEYWEKKMTINHTPQYPHDRLRRRENTLNFRTTSANFGVPWFDWVVWYAIHFRHLFMY